MRHVVATHLGRPEHGVGERAALAAAAQQRVGVGERAAPVLERLAREDPARAHLQMAVVAREHLARGGGGALRRGAR